ncbi:MAG: hypothetical protein Q8O19_05645, partial [Rectinemataceae bacterium]|nr:hypothetical protein [Rectinemataceae bacterium]
TQEGGHTNRCNYFDIFVSFTKETPSRSQKHGKSNTIIKGNLKMKKKNCKSLSHFGTRGGKSVPDVLFMG